jgi:hypothetical protein
MKLKIGQIVSIEFGHLSVVKEIFQYGNDTLASVHYIDVKTGNLMECPDKKRCKHERTCPIHGRNIRFDEAKIVNNHDLEFMVKEGMVSAELATVGKQKNKECLNYLQDSYAEWRRILRSLRRAKIGRRKNWKSSAKSRCSRVSQKALRVKLTRDPNGCEASQTTIFQRKTYREKLVYSAEKSVQRFPWCLPLRSRFESTLH